MAFAHPNDRPVIDPKNPPAQVRPTLDTGPGLTKQAHKRDSDINVIVAKYAKTGVIEFANQRAPEYMAMDEIDFQQAMDMVIRANEMFADLPATARKEFDNDPAKFLNFVHDPANEEKMVEMGLAVKRSEPGPDGILGTPDDTTIVDKTPGDPD